MSCREGRADPEMRSAKRTTLCRALQSWFVALLYHTEMHSDSPSHRALGRYRHVLFQAVSYVDWKFLIIDLVVEMGVFTVLALFLKPLH